MVNNIEETDAVPKSVEELLRRKIKIKKGGSLPAMSEMLAVISHRMHNYGMQKSFSEYFYNRLEYQNLYPTVHTFNTPPCSSIII